MPLPDPPPLTDAEEASLQNLRAMDPHPSPKNVDRIEAALMQMRLAASGVVGDSEDVSDGKVAALGLIARSQELLHGAVDAIAAHNRHVTAACLRGLTETFGALAYAVESPDELPKLLSDPTTLKGKKLVDAGDRRLKGVYSDYNWLSDAVHPGRRSLLIPFHATGEIDEETGSLPVRFKLPIPDFEADEVRESARVSAALGGWVLKLVGELIEAVEDGGEVSGK